MEIEDDYSVSILMIDTLCAVTFGLKLCSQLQLGYNYEEPKNYEFSMLIDAPKKKPSAK